MAGRMDTITVGLIIMAMVIFPSATAETYLVGDAVGWTIPRGGDTAYQTWATSRDFEVGDVVVFNWNGTDNVAEVSKADYDNCIKTNPINGTIQQTSPVNITLDSNTTRYFICTVGSHCELGQKVAISVGSNPSSVGSSLTIGAFFGALLSILVVLILGN